MRSTIPPQVALRNVRQLAVKCTVFEALFLRLCVLFFLLRLILSAVESQAASHATVVLSGTTSSKLTRTVPDFTIIDATAWKSIAVGNGTGTAVEIGKSSDGGANIIWRGGVIQGSLPLSWDWTTTHDYGGAGITQFNNGPAEWQCVRIHNVEDAIKSREVPEYSNTGSWRIRDSYFTAIRDDAFEDDRFEPGVIENCLVDGTYTVFSEQNENVGTSDPIGPNEESTTYIRRLYVRSYPTNKTPDGTSNRYIGPWFKLQGRGVENHRVVVEDSVFAIGHSAPDMKWSNFSTPSQVTWSGDKNYILWLGSPGGYRGDKPPGVHFLEDAPARAKWIEVRNNWLTSHGLPAQSFEADYDPHTAPVDRVPFPPSSLALPAAPSNLRLLR